MVTRAKIIVPAKIMIKIDKNFPFMEFRVTLRDTIFDFCKRHFFPFWICVMSRSSHVTLLSFHNSGRHYYLARVTISDYYDSFGQNFRFRPEFQISARVSDQGFGLLDSAIVSDNFDNMYNLHATQDLPHK